MATLVEIVKIVFLCLAIVVLPANTAKYKSCNLHSVKRESCPDFSACSQLDFTTGDCRCLDGYDFNEHHKNSSDYCLKSNKTTFDSSASNYVPNDNDQSQGGAKNQTNLPMKTIVHIQPPASSHHLLFGIVVSLLSVVAVLAATFAVKKMNPVRRLREYIITRRRSRPMYADVTMSQENDDPPLI